MRINKVINGRSDQSEHLPFHLKLRPTCHTPAHEEQFAASITSGITWNELRGPGPKKPAGYVERLFRFISNAVTKMEIHQNWPWCDVDTWPF